MELEADYTSKVGERQFFNMWRGADPRGVQD